jgi:hypothetical protein
MLKGPHEEVLWAAGPALGKFIVLHSFTETIPKRTYLEGAASK